MGLDELERLAKAATKGPYYYGRSNGRVGGKPEDGSGWGYANVWTNARTAEARNPVVGKKGNSVAHFYLHSGDAAYFAALDPDTVLGLVREARKGRKTKTGPATRGLTRIRKWLEAERRSNVLHGNETSEIDDLLLDVREIAAVLRGENS